MIQVQGFEIDDSFVHNQCMKIGVKLCFKQEALNELSERIEH